MATAPLAPLNPPLKDPIILESKIVTYYSQHYAGRLDSGLIAVNRIL